jgi:hypothetical protein
MCAHHILLQSVEKSFTNKQLYEFAFFVYQKRLRRDLQVDEIVVMRNGVACHDVTPCVWCELQKIEQTII